MQAGPAGLLYSSLVKAEATPPLGQPLQLVHPVLPRRGRLWGAGRPSYPDEPPSAAAVEAGVRAWQKSGVGLVLSLIEDWEVPQRAPGLFETLASERIDLRRYPIADFGGTREVPGSGSSSATSGNGWPSATESWSTATPASAGRLWCWRPS